MRAGLSTMAVNLLHIHVPESLQTATPLCGCYTSQLRISPGFALVYWLLSPWQHIWNYHILIPLPSPPSASLEQTGSLLCAFYLDVFPPCKSPNAELLLVFQTRLWILPSAGSKVNGLLWFTSGIDFCTQFELWVNYWPVFITSPPKSLAGLLLIQLLLLPLIK